ncbi:hypothetical protein V6N12_025610 [Hibiscus sabdariffa]|uniref:Uncharacterized protein n=1 Tax=Hibiscus sabdariffa TaxID=183260 RepID=A0ABR2CIX5_9ROSI
MAAWSRRGRGRLAKDHGLAEVGGAAVNASLTDSDIQSCIEGVDAAVVQGGVDPELLEQHRTWTHALCTR